jgi:GH25 family lysozyme M1 (1,4-beta-N-acetylmuramidase)
MARTLGLRGIDISQHQSVTPPLGDLSYVILRSSISQTKDTRYDQHYAAARKAGLVVMAYHFAYSADQSSIAEQVQVFLTVAKDADFLWLDQEEAGFDDDQAQHFVNLVRASGRPCGLYHSASGFGGVDADAQWVADYRDASVSAGYPRRVSDGAEMPGWDLWQWTSTGTLPGYTGSLDMNWMNPASPLAKLLRAGYISKAVADAAAEAAMVQIGKLENQVTTLQTELMTAQNALSASEAIVAARDAEIVRLNGDVTRLRMALDAAPKLEKMRIADAAAQAERDRIMGL